MTKATKTPISASGTAKSIKNGWIMDSYKEAKIMKMIIRENRMANFIWPFSSSVRYHSSSIVAEKPGGSCIQKAVRELKGGIPYHIRLSKGCITERNDTIVTNTINGVLNMCGKDNFMFRIDDFQPDNPTEEDVRTMQRFISIVKRVSEERLELVED